MAKTLAGPATNSKDERLWKGFGVKYHNRIVRTKDGVFHSKKEHDRYLELKLLEAARTIQGLRRQVTYELAPRCVLDGKVKRSLRYVADFEYTEDGKVVTEDVKGFKNRVYLLKRHLMKTVQNIEVRET